MPTSREELHQRETLCHELTENAYDMITTLSLEGIVLSVNSAVAPILGWTPEEMLGQPYGQFLSPDSVTMMAERARSLVTGEDISSYEIEIRHKNGRVVRLESRARLLRGQTGQPANILTISRENKKHNHTAEALATPQATTQAMLQALLQASPLAIIALDADGNVQFWNPAAERIFGWSAQEALGRPYPLVPPDQWDAFMAAHRCVLQGSTFTGFEVRRQKKDGTPIELSVATALVRDAQGIPLAAMGVLANITARKHAETIIQEEGKVARVLARVGPELNSSLNTPVLLDQLCHLTAEVLDADYNHTIPWQSKENAYMAVAGYGKTPEQTEARRAFKAPAERYSRLSVHLRQEGIVERATEDLRDPVEQSVLQRLRISKAVYLPLRRNDEIIGVQSVWYRKGKIIQPHHRHIARGTSQVVSLALANAMLVEELERVDQLKEEFIGSVSHELRTPLHIIMGYTELLEDQAFGPLIDTQKQPLARINHSAQELLDLINTTLDLSRLQNGRVLPVRQRVDGESLFADLAEDMRELTQHSSITIDWQLGNDLPALFTDPIKLRMILKNLLTNALKFTERGAVTVSANRQGKDLAFSVRDTGIGLAPEALPFIFEPFRQATSSTTLNKTGVGLGLYIVRQLVELLGGTVSATSSLGKGSTFHVTIPLQPEEQ